MATTFNVISLGVLPDIDTVEGNNNAENAPALVGMTFGGIGDSLVDDFRVFSPGSTGFAGGQSQRYDQDNSPAETFRIDGGADQVFDAAVRYTGTITYIDGTTDTADIVIFQDTAGNAYIAPDINASPSQTALEFAAIRSIRIDSVKLANTSGLVADRQGFNYVACFTPGARIATPGGEVAVEALAVGDPVTTRDNGAQPIRWIGRATRPVTPALMPVRIARGALGCGLPRADLVVSPQHRMLLASRIAERLTGRREVLLPARKLLGLPGIAIADPGARVTYLHLLLDRHEIIFAEGAPTESLLTGPIGLQAMPAEARAEIEALFPGILARASRPARTIPDARIGGQLVHRHIKNRRTPIEA